jgi:hypothetical protein
MKYIKMEISVCSVLRVKVNKSVSEVGVSALSKLEHLREFSFFSAWDKNDNAAALRLCLQLLPHLHVAGHRFTHRDLRDEQDRVVRTLASVLVDVRRPYCLGLQQVALVGVSRLPDDVQLPNLDALVLLEPRSDILQPDDRLSRLSELVLLDASSNVVTPLLLQLGPQLRSLSLRVCNASLDIVLFACPNLTELNVRVTGHLGFEQPLQPLLLQQLQVLRLEGSDTDEWMKTKLLPQLLQAPLLSRVRLDTVALSLADTQSIVQQLADHAILQQLKKFSFKGVGHYDLDTDTNQREVLMSAVALHCPLIEAFDVYYN